MSANPVDRRQFERFALQPMYTDVTVQRGRGMRIDSFRGHAYDISQCGIRIELDEALEIGESVNLHLGLPGEELEVHATGEVVWRNERDDDPGPRRMAVHFHGFLSDSDRDRLVRFLGSGLYRVA